MTVRFRARHWVFVAAFLLASHARAEIGVRCIFPSAANTIGADGAVYRTALSIRNMSPESMTVLIRLATPDGPSQVASVPLGQGDVFSSDDVLGEVFAYSGGAALELVDSEASHVFLATAYVHTIGATGRVTTQLRSLFPSDRLPEFPSYSVAQLPRPHAQARASFGCANFDTSAATVLVNVVAQGFAPQIVVLDLPPGHWQQMPVSLSGDELGFFFQETSLGGPLGTFCYGVAVDNTSHDGLYAAAEGVPSQ